MCFNRIQATRKEPILVFETLEAVVTEGSPKQFKFSVKNTGPVAGSLLSKVFIRESTTFDDIGADVVWNSSSIAPNAVSSGTTTFDWISGKTYFVRVATNEGAKVQHFIKAP